MFLKFCYHVFVKYTNFVAHCVFFSIHSLPHNFLSLNIILSTLYSMQIGSLSHCSWSIHNCFISLTDAMHSLTYMLYIKNAMDIMIKIWSGSEVMFSLCSMYSLKMIFGSITLWSPVITACSKLVASPLAWYVLQFPPLYLLQSTRVDLLEKTTDFGLLQYCSWFI